MDTTKKLTHISLCAGYGGIDIGLQRAIGNVRTVAYVEIEAFAVANLVAKMEKGYLEPAPIWSNLKTFPWWQFSEKVDILSGGFPCQPFSCAGKRQGTDDPRHLFPYIVTGISIIRPTLIFLENVEGIVSKKLGKGWNDPEGTSVLLHVLRELERLGYRATAVPSSASEASAPHQRNRWFIFGMANESYKRCRGRTDSDSLPQWMLQILEKEERSDDWSEAPRCSGEPTKLADNSCERIEKLSGKKSGQPQQPTVGNRCISKWPARPNQPQYCWEPPRVVVDS